MDDSDDELLQNSSDDEQCSEDRPNSEGHPRPERQQAEDSSRSPSAPNTDSETATLLQRAFDGEAEVLGPLLDRFRPLLRSKARESLGAPLLARIDESDVVQQTCLLVVQQFDQLRGRTVGDFVAWLLQVHQHNLLNMVDHHRGAAKRAVDREHADDGQAAANIPAQLTSPSQKAVRGERRSQLEGAIDELPEGQREAVRMRFLDEASLAEIAQQMDRSEDAVAGLLKRGMAQLKRILK